VSDPLSLFPSTLIELNFRGSTPCIYFLCRERKIVYIGQSTNLWARLGFHIRSDMEFNRIFALPLKKEDEFQINDVELAFIGSIRPEYNKNSEKACLLERHVEILRRYGASDLVKFQDETTGGNNASRVFA
jgi:hypothetical protein